MPENIVDVEVPHIQWAVRDLPGGDSILLMVVESSGSHHEFFVCKDEGFTDFYRASMDALRKAGNDLHSKAKLGPKVPKLIEVKGVLPNGSSSRVRSEGRSQQ